MDLGKRSSFSSRKIFVHDIKSHPEQGSIEEVAVTMSTETQRLSFVNSYLPIYYLQTFRKAKKVLGNIIGDRLDIEKSSSSRAQGLE